MCKINVTVVLPSLNPDEKLAATISALLERGFQRIIVVDDGSDAEHIRFFACVVNEPFCTLLHHDQNYGKGHALKTAMRYYLEHLDDAAGIITVDGDGQHHPDDVFRCAQMLLEGEVVLGIRDFNQPDIPLRSRFGNKSTAFFMRTLCGIRIHDTQTGLRAIPNPYIPLLVLLPGERFDYEMNMLLEFKKQHIPFRETTIRTIYLEENVSSHFRPLSDSAAIYGQLFKFLGASLLSFGVDILLFFLLNLFLPFGSALRIFWATVVSRVVSSLVNYCINRGAVFKSRGHIPTTVVRYYLLCVVQMVASFALVWCLDRLFGGGAIGFKVLVDGILFCISFQIQKEWVFGDRRSTHEKVAKC